MGGVVCSLSDVIGNSPSLAVAGPRRGAIGSSGGGDGAGGGGREGGVAAGGGGGGGGKASRTLFALGRGFHNLLWWHDGFVDEGVFLL